MLGEGLLLLTAADEQLARARSIVTRMAPQARRHRNARGDGVKLYLEIIQAATRLIDQHINRLTLAAVAKETGIAGPSIYDHFPGVEEIRFEVMRRCYADLASRVNDAQRDLTDPLARFDATCTAYLGYAADFPYRYALLFRGERDQAEKAAVGEQGATALQTLVDAVSDCANAGLSHSANTYNDAVAVWSALHGLATLRTARPNFTLLQDPAWTINITRRLALIDH